VSRHDGVAIAVREVFSLVESTPIIVLNYGVVDPTTLKWRIDRNLWHVMDILLIEIVVLGARAGMASMTILWLYHCVFS
jgi:hypothetical protein